MKGLLLLGLTLGGASLILLGASAGSTAHAPPGRTLVTENGRIRAFAQDTGAVSWIGPGYLVHVRRIGAKRGAVIGDARQEGGPVRIAARPLALAGTRAVWTSYNGGNTLETHVHAGPPT